jgi:hypothetical protein
LYAFRGRGAASRECSPLRTSPTEEWASRRWQPS